MRKFLISSLSNQIIRRQLWVEFSLQIGLGNLQKTNTGPLSSFPVFDDTADKD